MQDLRAARGRASSALPEAPRVRNAGAGSSHGGGPAAEEEAGGGGEKWRGRHSRRRRSFHAVGLASAAHPAGVGAGQDRVPARGGTEEWGEAAPAAAFPALGRPRPLRALRAGPAPGPARRHPRAMAPRPGPAAPDPLLQPGPAQTRLNWRPRIACCNPLSCWYNSVLLDSSRLLMLGR